MDAMQKGAAAAPARVYQDFEPQTELIVEADCDMLLVYLSGFRKKEQLRVQVNKTRNLVISGEHPVGDNIWRRFQMTFPVSTECDIGKITAKFENLILYIRLPKLIATAEKQDQEKPTSTKAPDSPKAVNEQKPPNNPSSMTSPAEHIGEKSNAPAENDGSFSEKAKEKENAQKTSDSKNMPEMAPGNNQNHESDSTSGITKLKMARKVMYCVLALLLAVVVGLYVQKLTWFLGEKAGN